MTLAGATGRRLRRLASRHRVRVAAKWKAWLAKHHTTSPGVWLEIAKKGSAFDSVSYAEAIEVALCYGWIDGQKAAADDDRWRQRFTPAQAPQPVVEDQLPTRRPS